MHVSQLCSDLVPWCFLPRLLPSPPVGDGEIGAEWILLGVWAQRDSAGHKLLATLGFTDALAAELESEVRR